MRSAWSWGMAVLAAGYLPVHGAEQAAFVQAAQAKHGEAGARAAAFLWSGMPESDRRTLDLAFLMENLDLALEARSRFPWAKAVPEALFLNDVLPYASVDETREPWRRSFLALAGELVKGCRTATEAAQALNRELFKRINVHYNTGRKKPNQSPAESMAQGRATCTGLSILLVDACRAVGIPARLAGTAQWATKEGNHTWVEIWDGRWQFTGADEYDAQGLDRGWFVEDASMAEAGHPTKAVFATSWAPTGRAFPMVWDPDNRRVPGLDVSERYTRQRREKGTAFHVRLRRAVGGERLVAPVELRDGAGRVLATGETRAGHSDLNDMPSLAARVGEPLWVRVRMGKDVRETEVRLDAPAEQTLDLAWKNLKPVSPALLQLEAWLARPAAERGALPNLPLSRGEADRATRMLAADAARSLAPRAQADVDAKELQVQGKTLRWMERTFGSAPEGKRSLWISLHGGGGAPKELNDQQWQNQIRLYEPAEGIYVAPRGPSDTWNLWHEDHIDPMFDRLIADYVATRGVDPDRVYILGYSAGGDGVYQLAPRMADRWAAAAMMAGHPNDASPLPLRNLPFALFMGGEDAAYRRNAIAAEWGQKLDVLQKEDPQGYVHRATIYPGLGHWMERKDAEALPWMQGFTRTAWPHRVIWVQDDVTSTRFYWLCQSAGTPRAGQVVTAQVKGQVIELEAKGITEVGLRLSDCLVDLDQPITVRAGGKVLFQGKVARSLATIQESLQERLDATTAASVRLTVRF